MASIDRKRRAQKERAAMQGKPYIAAKPKTDKSPTTETREQEIARLIRVYGLGRAGHSHFSPSSSAGWMNCKGFLLANAAKGDMAGEDAAYGTVAHHVAAVWLTAIRDEGRTVAEHVPERFLDWSTVENGFKITVDENMIYHIRRYIEWCEEVEIEGDVFIEAHVDYSVYMPIPNQGGTADHFVCISPVIDEKGRVLEPGTLVITDLKMGTGVKVFVENNSQAMSYALGVYLEWNWLYSFKKIVIRICQPRLDYFGVWWCTDADLLAFGERMRVAADAAWRENAPRSPSPKACQWCNDVACPARSALIADLVDDAFDDSDVIEGWNVPEYDQATLDDHALMPLFGAVEPVKFKKPMSISLMAWRYGHRAWVEKYFREIGEELLRLAQAGEHVPGWKIVDGRRSFAWYDPDWAAEQLSIAGVPEKDIFVTEVTSVAKAKEKLKAVGLKPKEIKALLHDVTEDDPDAVPLVVTTPGRPTLAPSTDDREDARDEIDDAFADDDDDL